MNPRTPAPHTEERTMSTATPDPVRIDLSPIADVVREIGARVSSFIDAVWDAWRTLNPPREPGQQVPEVWESYALPLLDTERPAPGTRAHDTAAHETATQIVLYLTAVARIREKATP